MLVFDSNNKLETLKTCREVFKRQIELDNKTKERLLEKIQEIEDMNSYVVETGWLFEDLVEDTVSELYNIHGIKEVDCNNFETLTKQAIVCLAAYQSPIAKNALDEYLNLIDDLKPVATREQMILPLQNYVNVCDKEMLYLNKQIEKLNRVIEKYSENAKNNKAPIKNQGEGKE